MRNLQNVFTLKALKNAALCLAAAISLSACTKETPVVEASSFSGITIVESGSQTKTVLLNGASTTVHLSGSCLPTMTKLWIQNPYTLQWQDVSSIAQNGADLDCSDGTYSFNLATDSGIFSYDRQQPLDKIVGIRGTTKEFAAADYYFNLVYGGQIPPTISFSTTDFTVLETGMSATITIALSAPSAVPITFSLAISGTAFYSSDYSLSPSLANVTLNPGVTTYAIQFGQIDDLTVEPNETVVIGITNIANATAGAKTTLNINILDDDFGTFNITGITGASDATLDNNLVNGSEPHVNWSTSNTAESYSVTVYASDGTTIVCPAATVNSPTVQYFFTGCNLTLSQSYVASVAPFKNSVSGPPVTYNFIYNAPPVVVQNIFYAMNGEPQFTIPLSSIFIDPEGGAVTIQTLTGSSEPSSSVANNTNEIHFTPGTVYYGSSTMLLEGRDSAGSRTTTTITIKHMSEHTWTGDGGNVSWSDAANWCGNVNAARTNCLGNGTNPLSSSIVVIDETCLANCNPNVNMSSTVQKLYLKGGRTLNQPNIPMTIGAGGFYISNNSFFFGGTANLTINGPLQVASGSSFRASSATTSLNSNATFQNGSTFNHNNGVIELKGNNSGGADIVNFDNNPTLNRLQLTKSVPGSTTLLGNLTVLLEFTAQASLSGASTAVIDLKGDTYINGSGISATLGSSTVRLSGNNNQLIFITDVNHSFGNLEIVKASGVAEFNVSGGPAINITGNFLYNSGNTPNLNVPTQYFRFSGGVTNSNISIPTDNFVFPVLQFMKAAGKSVVIDNTVTAKELQLDNADNSSSVQAGVGAGEVHVKSALYTSGYAINGTAKVVIPDSVAIGQTLNIYSPLNLPLIVNNTAFMPALGANATISQLTMGNNSFLHLNGYNLAVQNMNGLLMNAGSLITLGGSGTLTVNGSNIPAGPFGGGNINP